jgi:hypothetical protein
MTAIPPGVAMRDGGPEVIRLRIAVAGSRRPATPMAAS